MEIHYPALFTKEETGYFVQFVDLEEAFTEGETLESAQFYAAEVLTLTLQGRLEEGQPIPEPSPAGEGMLLIAPDAKTQAALLFRRARQDRTIADVARALGTSWPAAQRLEDPNHWPSLKQLEKAAAVLGRRLVLSFE
ncbi:MAG: type II toxin-antitoxin system HicB family antitoxin [Magnetococcales bacterium]|nr:type II toxin-antitoxin system HicB family antitoxin [Magnetococcales bacterium]